MRSRWSRRLLVALVAVSICHGSIADAQQYPPPPSHSHEGDNFAAYAYLGLFLCIMLGCFGGHSGVASGGGGSSAYLPPRANAPAGGTAESSDRSYGLHGDCPQPGAGYGC